MQNKTIEKKNNTKKLLTAITEGIQEKKGHRIVIADFSNIKDSICKYFVICQANTATQVEAIAGSVSDTTREKLGEKAIGVTGLENAYWVAIDYGDIIVHVLQPQAREFYDLEHLWADAKLTEVPEDY
ncbi:MAG: ribosome silencing factor [Bacteroidaceae bacterium]|nr:ribosome silencing factor [Bacteroidaceae bacterium]